MKNKQGLYASFVCLLSIAVCRQCDHPANTYANAFFRVKASKYEQKVAGCSDFSGSAVCYARCLPDYVQTSMPEIQTRITCDCSGEVCSWIPSRQAFRSCFGPCATPQVTREDISKYFKIVADYSKRNVFFTQRSNVLLVAIRVQAKFNTDTWSKALVFSTPQNWNIESAEANLAWNCNKRILMITPKPHAKNLAGAKRYTFRALITNAKPSDVTDTFEMHFFDQELTPDGANCQDKLFLENPEGYCGDNPEPTIKTTTQTSPETTQLTTTRQTKVSTTSQPITITTVTSPLPTKPGTCDRGADLTNKGELTQYTDVPDGGNCAYNWEFTRQHKANTHFVALPSTFSSTVNGATPYNGHMSCGKCLRLRCSCEQTNKHFKELCDGGKDSVVMVTDSCPTCHGAGDLDLSLGGWNEATGDAHPSRFDGSYEFVTCPMDFINGNKSMVRWKSGSSIWYPVVKVEFGPDEQSLLEAIAPHLAGANSFYFGLHKPSTQLFPDPVTICVTNSQGTRACGSIPIVGDEKRHFELDALL